MAITEVSICNGALTLLGADRITALTQDTEEAKICLERYSYVRDSVLQIHPWAFCIFRAYLTANLEGPIYDYQYKFQLPTTPYCLMVLEVWEDEDWVIEEHYILCNTANINIKYIGRVTDTSTFPPIIADLISSRLALEIAYKITGSAAMVQNMDRLYHLRMNEVLSRESKLDNMPYTASDIYSDNWFTKRI